MTEGYIIDTLSMVTSCRKSAQGWVKLVEMVSYEDLVDNFSVPGDRLGEECSDKVLRLVSSKLETWKNAAPHFELEDAVYTIDNGNHDEEGKRYELLRRWKQKFGYKGTNEKLIRCLLASSRADLAGTVAKEITGEAAARASKYLSPYGTQTVEP